MQLTCYLNVTYTLFLFYLHGTYMMFTLFIYDFYMRVTWCLHANLHGIKVEFIFYLNEINMLFLSFLYVTYVRLKRDFYEVFMLFTCSLSAKFLWKKFSDLYPHTPIAKKTSPLPGRPKSSPPRETSLKNKIILF